MDESMTLTRERLQAMLAEVEAPELEKAVALVFLNNLSDEQLAALDQVAGEIVRVGEEKGIEAVRALLEEWQLPSWLIEKVMAHTPSAAD